MKMCGNICHISLSDVWMRASPSCALQRAHTQKKCSDFVNFECDIEYKIMQAKVFFKQIKVLSTRIRSWMNTAFTFCIDSKTKVMLAYKNA